MPASPRTTAGTPQVARAPWPLRRGDPAQLLQLLLLGLLVGLACWPLNQIDAWQSHLLELLPGFSGGPWTLPALALALAPLLVLPPLLVLQNGALASGAGSGIPQTMLSLEQADQTQRLLGPRATLSRLMLWTVASLALLPLGREGPVVQVGAAVAQALRRWAPGLVAAGVRGESLLAIGAGAGLAGGFNSPLMGTLFVMEELTGRFATTTLLWPALVVCAAAALVSNLDGIPLFPLGMMPTLIPEWQQLLWAMPVGAIGGLLGGLFARSLLGTGRWLRPRLRQRPWLWGAGVGALLTLLALLSGGLGGGDGEDLMGQLLIGHARLPVPGAPLSWLGWLSLIACRLVGPVLALATGIPGGLIDPALTIGAVFGSGSLHLLGADPQLGLALGMAAGLAGATQLPLVTLVFCLRLAGDQQWLFGILLSAVIAAWVGRRIQRQPIYHALCEDLQQTIQRR
jgi:H+/Cl- antiporter ClcA